MKINCISSLLITSSLVFFSCKKELEPQESASSANSQTETAPVNPENSALSSQASGTTVNNTSVVAQSSTINNPAATTAPGMNPPHGQANHRCDIAVGAPLNSPKAAPVTTVSKPTVSTPATTTASTPPILNSNATPVVTQPGMNPPHGQEGHVCSVAVGAPLPKQ